MSPSELISTRCPGRLYKNRNLPERGTVSCSQVGGLFADAPLHHTRVGLRDHVTEQSYRSNMLSNSSCTVSHAAACRSAHLVIDDIP
jgi:hypothetical protein